MVDRGGPEAGPDFIVAVDRFERMGPHAGGGGHVLALLTESIAIFHKMGLEKAFLAVDRTKPSAAHRLYADPGYRAGIAHLRYRKAFVAQGPADAGWRRSGSMASPPRAVSL